jgi:hypothetical protein
MTQGDDMRLRKLFVSGGLKLSVATLVAAGACAADEESGLGTKEARLEAVCVDAPEAVPAEGWICGEERVAECNTHAGATVEHIHVVLASAPEEPASEATEEASATAAAEEEGATEVTEEPAARTPIPTCATVQLGVDPGPFPVGEHEVVVWGVPAAEGGEALELCASTLIVRDTTPPTVTPKTVELWPPNHKMHAIAPLDCVDVEDACDGEVRVDFLWASSDEPEDAKGDGKTAPDIADLGCDGVSLRAERQGGGDGRVYTLGWRATDDAGNTTEGTCQVVVPHDQGKAEMIDSGAAYQIDAPACE